MPILVVQRDREADRRSRLQRWAQKTFKLMGTDPANALPAVGVLEAEIGFFLPR